MNSNSLSINYISIKAYGFYYIIKTDFIYNSSPILKQIKVIPKFIPKQEICLLIYCVFNENFSTKKWSKIILPAKNFNILN